MLKKYLLRAGLIVGVAGIGLAGAQCVIPPIGPGSGGGGGGGSCPQNACVSCWNAPFLCRDNQCRCACNVVYCDSV